MSIINQEEDHLSLIKAAAWTWHRHGSDKPVNVPESELIRTRVRARTSFTAPRPTRYKLEAESGTPDRNSTRLSSSSLLLDLYEIERITRELENLIGSAGKKGSGLKRTEKKVNRFCMCRSTRNDVVEAAAVLDGRRRAKARAVA